MASVQLNEQLDSQFTELIIKLFKRQTSTCIIILGRRESGKTDLSLLIAEILAFNNIMRHFATNIRVYASPFEVIRITNLEDLELWCKNNSGKKLFIFDEAGKSLRRRTPMSRLNIRLLDNLQILRKYKLNIIFIAPHEKYMDNAALGSDVIDAVFHKYRNKKVALYRDEMENYTLSISNIPRTSIDFDTWDVAPFTSHGVKEKPLFKDRDLEVAYDWSHGKTAKDLGLHSMQLHRILKKVLKEVTERESHVSL